MRYVALLRGINVGGNNKVDMTELKGTFERVGCEDVRTYINSGNVVFARDGDADSLADLLEDAIEEDFGKRHQVLLRNNDALQEIVATMPDSWTTDKTMRTRVFFLWEDVDTPGLVDELPIREGVDEVRHTPGAVVWRVDADKLTKSGMGRLIGTDLYSAMTMRNSNTVRKLAEMMRPSTDP